MKVKDLAKEIPDTLLWLQGVNKLSKAHSVLKASMSQLKW